MPRIRCNLLGALDGQFPSGLFARSYPTATGAAGNVTISTGKLILSNGARVSASALGQGQGGNLSVTASDLVELSGTDPSGQFSSNLLTDAGDGAAGDLTIKTGKLILSDGAQVTTSTFGQGQGGNLSVTASDLVELSGTSPEGYATSGLFTQAQGTGAAGDLTIATGNLLVQNGARVAASTLGQGNSGNIQINATSVNLSGISPSGITSGLFTRTSGVAQAGTINVNSSTFRLADGALVDATTTGQGNITNNSNAFRGGNININANTFDVTNGGQVRTTTLGTGVAGDINLKVLHNVNLQGQSSGIFANTAAGSTGNGGSILIDPNQLSITNGAQVAVGSMGQGEAGNIFMQAGAITLDRGLVSATAASVNGGNISLQASKSLLLRHGSQISATAGTAFAGGNGGKISIDNTALVIAFPTEGSDISANAFKGNGGLVKINAMGIFGFQSQPTDTPLSDITASSTGGGINGVVNTNTLDVDPSRGLVALPVILADASKQIASGCAAGNGTTGSRFVITGRGGLPSNPSEPLSSEAVWSDTRFIAATGKPQHRKNVSSPQPSASAEVAVVPATGWVFDGKGDVTLTAAVPSDRIEVPWLTPASCHAQ